MRDAFNQHGIESLGSALESCISEAISLTKNDLESRRIIRNILSKPLEERFMEIPSRVTTLPGRKRKSKTGRVLSGFEAQEKTKKTKVSPSTFQKHDALENDTSSISTSNPVKAFKDANEVKNWDIERWLKEDLLAIGAKRQLLLETKLESSFYIAYNGVRISKQQVDILRKNHETILQTDKSGECRSQELWLDTEIISAGIELLNVWGTDNQDTLSFWALDPYALQIFDAMDPSSMNKWKKHLNFCFYEWIFFPVIRGCHFLLIAYKKSIKALYWLDSLGTAMDKNLMDLVEQFLSLRAGATALKKVAHSNYFNQKDDWSCGWVILEAIRVLAGLKSMPYQFPEWDRQKVISDWLDVFCGGRMNEDVMDRSKEWVSNSSLNLIFEDTDDPPYFLRTKTVQKPSTKATNARKPKRK